MNQYDKEIAEIKQRLLVIEQKLSITQHNEPVKNYIDVPIPERQSTPVKRKVVEAAIGKYIVGGIAALLIFAAAMSLISLLWQVMSNEVKFALIVLSGMGLSAVGFIRMYKHKNAISSILLGVGAGLIYIGFAAGNIALGLFSEVTAVCMVATWAVGLILSYRLTQLRFITIIAYIGAFLTICFMLSEKPDLMGHIVICLFGLIAASSLCTAAKVWMSKLWAYSGGILAFVLMLPQSLVLTVEVLFDSDKSVILGILISVLYCFYLYTQRTFDKLKYQLKHMALEIMSFFIIVLVWALSYGLLYSLDMHEYQWMLVATAVCALVFIESRKVITVPLWMLACLISYTVSVLPSVWMALGIGILAVVIAGQKSIRFNKNGLATLLLGVISFYQLLFHMDYDFYTSGPVSNTIYIIDVIALMFAMIGMLLRRYRDGEKRSDWMYKITAFVITAIIISAILTAIVPSSSQYPQVKGLLFMILLSGISIGCFAFKYFTNWDMKERARTDLDKSGHIFVYLLMPLYVLDVIMLSQVTHWGEHLAAILTTLSVALLQSYILLKKYSRSVLAMVWTGTKYLILIWTTLTSTSNLDITTIWTSIAGLAVALLSVYVGFRQRIKSLRVYGLVLSLLMTIKVVLIDLTDDNGIYRILALLLGGAICFGISVLYTRLESVLKREDTTS